MPEVLTKYPEVVIKVLEGAGVRCGPGQQQKILTKCPPERFCTTPAGETCVYGVGELTRMTQIDRAEVAKLVCPPTTAGGTAGGGCAVGPQPPPLIAGVLGLLALIVALGVRRRFRCQSAQAAGP